MIEKVVVFGSGVMGGGIAQLVAARGFTVTMVDKSQSILQRSLDFIQKDLTRRSALQCKLLFSDAQNYVDQALSKLRVSDDTEKSVVDADLVIEAVPEHLPLKHSLFGTIDKVAPKSCYFASNTSSLSIREIASVCTSTRRSQFGGLHFLPHVPVSKLLEIIDAEETSQETVKIFKDFTDRLKLEYIVAKDTPGFVLNALLIPSLMDSLKLVDDGVASFEDVEKVSKLGLGRRFGPFEVLDLIGLDTAAMITDGWIKRFPTKSIEQSKIVTKMIAEGKLGRKSGEGFYKYKK